MLGAATESDEGLICLCSETLQFFYMPVIRFDETKVTGPGKVLFVFLEAGSGLFIILDIFGTCWSLLKVLRRFLKNQNELVHIQL